MQLNQVVPWGRSFDEHRMMFDLSDADLKKTILGCADGPASFNAEGTRQGCAITSCDPIYQFTAEEIDRRIQDVYPEIMAKVEKEAGNYIWEALGSVENLGKVRMRAMARFLSDFEGGQGQGRYVSAALPNLPFTDSAFDLALCSHYLFLYSDHMDGAAHAVSVRELCRVASEVRVFPVVSLDGTPSKHLDLVMARLSDTGMDVSLQAVGYRFQKGATEMLVARSV